MSLLILTNASAERQPEQQEICTWEDLKLSIYDDWPVRVRQPLQSAIAAPIKNENRFYGPWQELLRHCFSRIVEDDAADAKMFFLPHPQISPHYTINTSFSHLSTIDLTVLEFGDQEPDGKIVLFVEVKPPTQLCFASARQEADTQIRERYDVYGVHTKIPYLPAISAFGPHCRFYTGDMRSRIIEPELQDPPATHVPPDYLQGEWNINILTKEGRDKMCDIVKQILQLCNNRRG